MSTLKMWFSGLGIILLLGFSTYFMFAETNNKVKIEKTQETETVSSNIDAGSYYLKEMFPGVDTDEDFKQTGTIQRSKKMKSSSLFPPLVEEHFYDITEISYDYRYLVKPVKIERSLSFPSLLFMLGICVLAFASGLMSNSKSHIKPVSITILFLVSTGVFFKLFTHGTFPMYWGHFVGFYFLMSQYVFYTCVYLKGLLNYESFGRKYTLISLVASISIYCFSFAYLLNYDDNYLINKSLTFPAQDLILFFGLVILVEQFPTLVEKFKNFKTRTMITA